MDRIKFGVIYALSPTYGLITWLKKGLPNDEMTTRLRWWSRAAATLTALAVVAMLVAERCAVVDPRIIIGLGVLAFWRVNEIVFAFFKDAYDRLSGEQQTTTFTPPERLKFVAASYLE